MDPIVMTELQKLDTAVPFRAVSHHTHYTWARTFYSHPELYLQPYSIPELAKIVTLARRCRKRIVVVGCGHSPSDITCTSSWMVSLDFMNKVLSVTTRNDEVTMEAGIRLRDLGKKLGEMGLSMPNLGSIDDQSIAGAISTGTHGSSLQHGLMSESVTGLKIMLANGQVVSCSPEKNPQLFRAALISLGALGIIVEVSFRPVPAFKIAWEQSLHPLSQILNSWNTGLWTQAEFVRVWWLPYRQQAIIWKADKTDEPLRPPPSNFYGGKLGYYVYHSLLTVGHYIPSILPTVEWFVFGMQYGFKPGPHTVTTAVEPGHQGLLMNCLYSQFVNEWAIPIEKGPEAISRLGAWIHGDLAHARIPFPSAGVYVHCPIEVRVSDTSPKSSDLNSTSSRPYLDPTAPDTATLYLNATLYRPYGLDPPCTDRYYEAFEYLMRELGGKPHWAKNYSAAVTYTSIKAMYGENLTKFQSVRAQYDPEGMFTGAFQRRNLLPAPQTAASIPTVPTDPDAEFLALEEAEVSRHPAKNGGIEWFGARRRPSDVRPAAAQEGRSSVRAFESRSSSPRTPTTSTSDESFDVMAKGEASVFMSEAVEDDKGGEGDVGGEVVSMRFAGVSGVGEGIVR